MLNPSGAFCPGFCSLQGIAFGSMALEGSPHQHSSQWEEKRKGVRLLFKGTTQTWYASVPPTSY